MGWQFNFFGGANAFLPTNVGGCILWLRPDLGLTFNNSDGTVSQWNDQSGTSDANKDQLQGLPLLKPVLNASDAGYNGFPTLSLDQTDDFMAARGAWAVPVPAVATWFVVGETAPTADCWFLQSPNGNYEAFKLPNDPNYTMALYAGAVLYAGYGAEETKKRIWCFEFNGASSKIYRDSLTATVTGDAGGNTATAMNVVGSGGNLGGKIAEIIGYSGVLSLTDRTAVMTYLSTRYAEPLV